MEEAEMSSEPRKVPKLSTAQQSLLRGLSQQGRSYVASYYRPALKLVELGLAEWQGSKLALTDMGWRWIEGR